MSRTGSDACLRAITTGITRLISFFSPLNVPHEGRVLSNRGMQVFLDCEWDAAAFVHLSGDCRCDLAILGVSVKAKRW